MTDDQRRGKDEMNLAVLPIARLGRNDRRTRIEYYGTFRESGKEQEKMVWIVEGAAGLPTEFAERQFLAVGFGDQDVDTVSLRRGHCRGNPFAPGDGDDPEVRG